MSTACTEMYVYKCLYSLFHMYLKSYLLNLKKHVYNLFAGMYAE